MRKSIFNAVATLSFFSILDRALGFFFKIYLSYQLGAAALGTYQVALSFFFVLLTVTTSGIPLVVGKLTAKYRRENKLKSERSLTTAALILGLILAAVITVAVFLLRKPLSGMFADPKSVNALLLLLPALLFSAVYSAFRGNLWGRQRYFAVSVVEIVEQVVRILFCIAMITLGFHGLYMTALSLSVGCLISALACTLVFLKNKGALANPKGQLIPLLKSSAPITVSRAASSIINSLVAIVVPFLLIKTGHTSEQAMALFGSSIGMALPLLYIPITVVGSLAFVLIPTVSTSAAAGDLKGVNRQIESAIGFATVFAALFVPMFLSLGKPIGLLVYNNEVAGEFLSASAWLLIPLAIENITSSVMNSLDLEMKSFFNCLIGSGAMFILFFCFYGNFPITLLSVGMGISWLIASVLHILCIKKKTGLKFGYIPKLVKSVIVVIPAAFLTVWLHNLMGALPIAASILIAAVVSLIFYAALALVFGLIDFDFFKTKVKVSKHGNPKKPERKAISKKPVSPLEQVKNQT
ncbi:MAG: oligosaccharide flippase family protein [Clostridiales bacterium]|jgi:stage V sporulation protein B|nr:oligosaccharide flippase family protein [Clostridiales bacterium]